MSEAEFKKLKYSLISIVAIFEICHVLWEHLNGGVLSHHLLNQPDLPSISNGWGILILPLLAWVATTRIKKRIIFESDVTEKIPKSILIGFFGMLVISIVQSLAFELGYQNITMYIALGVLVTGLFLPIYRAECILGHVLGAVFVFGPVIPLIGILVMATISLFSNCCLKPLVRKIIRCKGAVSE